MNRNVTTPGTQQRSNGAGGIDGEPSVLVFDINETLIDFESMSRSSRRSSATNASCASGSAT
jgi:hypothetical protein